MEKNCWIMHEKLVMHKKHKKHKRHWKNIFFDEKSQLFTSLSILICVKNFKSEIPLAFVFVRCLIRRLSALSSFNNFHKFFLCCCKIFSCLFEQKTKSEEAKEKRKKMWNNKKAHTHKSNERWERHFLFPLQISWEYLQDEGETNWKHVNWTLFKLSRLIGIDFAVLYAEQISFVNKINFFQHFPSDSLSEIAVVSLKHHGLNFLTFTILFTTVSSTSSSTKKIQ